MQIDIESTKLHAQEVWIEDNTYPSARNAIVYKSGNFLVIESADSIKPECLPIFYNQRAIYKLTGVTIAEDANGIQKRPRWINKAR